MVTWGCSTRTALRMRVNISAMGSVIICVGSLLPTRLFDARNQPLVGRFAEANAAQTKLAIDRTRPAAHLTAPHEPRSKLRLPLGHGDFRFTGHRGSCLW